MSYGLRAYRRYLTCLFLLHFLQIFEEFGAVGMGSEVLVWGGLGWGFVPSISLWRVGGLADRGTPRRICTRGRRGRRPSMRSLVISPWRVGGLADRDPVINFAQKFIDYSDQMT